MVHAARSLGRTGCSWPVPHRGVVHRRTAAACASGARGAVSHGGVTHRSRASRWRAVAHRSVSAIASGSRAMPHLGVVHPSGAFLTPWRAVAHRRMVLTIGWSRVTRCARRNRAMTVSVTVTAERLPTLLSLAERPRALACNGIVTPAATGEHHGAGKDCQGQIALRHRPCLLIVSGPGTARVLESREGELLASSSRGDAMSPWGS